MIPAAFDYHCPKSLDEAVADDDDRRIAVDQAAVLGDEFGEAGADARSAGPIRHFRREPFERLQHPRG